MMAPMRIHILGHSDSRLDDGENPNWPARLRRIIESEHRGPLEFSTSRLAPYGSRAVGYAARRVEEAKPDVVILSVSAFTCTVGLVNVRVGQRFGQRAQRAYEAIEQRYSGRVARAPGAAIPVDRALRTLARRTIGTATLAPVEEVARVYSEILHTLSREERIQVIVMGESYFSRHVQRANPGTVTKIERLQGTVRPVAAAHHFPWVDIEAAFQNTSDREAHFSSDGVHNTPAGHQRVAEVVAAELREMLPV